MMTTLHRITCRDCPWFQTFERKEAADEAERAHAAGGHRVERYRFKGEVPTLNGKRHLLLEMGIDG